MRLFWAKVVEEGVGACAQFKEWRHFGGMVRDASVSTLQQGGSGEVATLKLAVAPTDPSRGYAVAAEPGELPNLVAEAGPANPQLGAFMLLFKYEDGQGPAAGARDAGPGVKVLGGASGACFAWNASGASLAQAFERALPKTALRSRSEVAVRRTGRGDATSDWGYTHTLTFGGGSATSGDMQVAAAAHRGVGGGVVFVPSPATVGRAGAGAQAGLAAASFAAVETNAAQAAEAEVGQGRLVGSAGGLWRVEYLGPLVWANGTRSVEQIRWSHAGGDPAAPGALAQLKGPAAEFAVANFTAGRPVALGKTNVTVALSSAVAKSLSPGDAWVLLVAVCPGPDGAALGNPQAPVPPLAVRAGAAVVQQGGAAARELTLGAAFGGDKSGASDLWLVNQEFAVRMPGTEVQRVLLGDTNKNGQAHSGPQTWDAGSPTFTLRFKGQSTACLNWDAKDHEVQQALRAIGAEVTVTRGTDAADAPNGFVWSVYFDSPELDNQDLPQLVANTTGNTFSRLDGQGNPVACPALNASSGEFVAVETVTQGDTQGGRFRAPTHTCGPAVQNDCPEAPTVPLARVTGGAYGAQDLTAPAYWVGGFEAGATAYGPAGASDTVDVYKVTGLRYVVDFDSNLGDLPSLAVDAGGLPGSSPSTHALVEGELPTSVALPGLPTGLPFFSRVTAPPRGSIPSGTGTPRSSSPGRVPAGVPPEPTGVAASVALHVDEVQTVTVIPRLAKVTLVVPQPFGSSHVS